MQRICLNDRIFSLSIMLHSGLCLLVISQLKHILSVSNSLESQQFRLHWCGQGRPREAWRQTVAGDMHVYGFYEDDAIYDCKWIHGYNHLIIVGGELH